MPDSLTAAQLGAIDDAIRSNQPILAIRTYREFTGASLAEANAFVQARSQALLEEPPPDLVRAFLASSFSRRGELVAWWRDRSGLPCTLVLFQRAPQPAFEVSLIEGSMFGHQVHGYTCTLAEVFAAADSGKGFRNVEWDVQGGGRVAEKIRAFAAALVPVAPRVTRDNSTTLHLLDAGAFEEEFLFLTDTVDAAWWGRVRAAAQINSDVSDALEEIEGEPSALPRHAGKLIMAFCIATCSRRSASTESTSQFFADLESSPPNWRSLPPQALVAWNQFLSMLGISGPPRSDLPPWLDGLRQVGVCAGLLPPPQVRLVARHAAPLRGLFAGNRDAGLLFDLIESAAAQGAWVLGVEPQG